MNRERKTNMNQSGFIYGGDYNPEQWLAKFWSRISNI
jgi:beta-galactosidase